jgi:hypothetical protein
MESREYLFSASHPYSTQPKGKVALKLTEIDLFSLSTFANHKSKRTRLHAQTQQNP